MAVKFFQYSYNIIDIYYIYSTRNYINIVFAIPPKNTAYKQVKKKNK